MYTAGLALFPMYKFYPRLPNALKWFGLPLMSAGLVAASFSESVTHLIITQGVVYALGGSMVYYPTLVWLDEWFVQKKGLAYGIMWAGRLSTPQGLPDNNLLTPQIRYRRCRSNHSIRNEQPPLKLRLPHHPTNLGPRTPSPLFTPNLLPPPPRPRYQSQRTSTTRPKIPQNKYFLVPDRRLQYLESGVFHTEYLSSDVCEESRAESGCWDGTGGAY